MGLSLYGPSKYIKTVSFIPQETTPLPAGLGALASGILAGSRPTASPQFYADLLESRDILEAVIATEYAVPGEFQGTLLTYFKIQEPDRDRAINEAMRELRDVVSVRADRQTGIVRIMIVTKYRDLSRQVADRFVQLVSEFNMERRRSTGRAEREFLERRLQEARSELRAAEEAWAYFRSRNRGLGSPSLVIEEERLQRQLNLRAQVFASLTQSYDAARLEEVRSTPLITVVERPSGAVEPKPRGTVKHTALAFTLGLVVAVGLAILLDAIRGFQPSELARAEARGLWSRLRSRLPYSLVTGV
jgi:uncharacterized protein involved in exopolysaccharide biosynthesis